MIRNFIKFPMPDAKIEIRVLLRFFWKKGLTATAATREICEVEGKDVVNERTARRWFERFNHGDTSLVDKHRSGRPSVVDDEALRAAVEVDPLCSTRKLSATLGPSKDTINRHLHQLGLVLKSPREEPHELTDAQAQRRVEICQQLLRNPLDDRFWKRIVTGDEKWIFLRNTDRKKQWVPRGEQAQPILRQDRFGQKVMISVWWNIDGILHFEFVPDGHAVDAHLYSEQLHRVYEVLRTRYPALVNRKRVLLQHDNAPAHRARLTQAAIREMDGFTVLPHPAYSPDCAPSDYGLFRSMQHFLRGKQFETIKEVEIMCREFFDSKPKEWYRRQIKLLAERWEKVLENNGLYFVE